ncbi:MAG: phosphotransferase family protein [Acidimicrobiia bacterium]|nr:phosphotransferase family protein [Acidimicrobiia bacterium]
MTDTAPIRPEEGFDEEAVGAFLSGAITDLAPPFVFEQFPGGKANLTYLARDAADRELVLRRPPLGEVAPGSHDMGREHRVLSRLWQRYPKAPRAFALCEDAAVMGKPFFVMERRQGVVVRETWPFDESSKRRMAASSLIDSLAELHEVDFVEVGLGDHGKPDGFVRRQIAGWVDRWHRAKTRELGDMDSAARALDSVPDPQRTVLLHNDFKLDNTMLGLDGAVTSVFDWDMSTLGDPLVDLGTALAYWADSESPTYRVFGSSAAELSPYLRPADAAQRYESLTGLDLSDLDFYVGLAYFRIAVIIEQIYARYVAGQTTDPRFAGLGELVPPLAAEARNTLSA